MGAATPWHFDSQVDWSFYAPEGPGGGDPLAILRASMALLPLGKERALAVVREVARVQEWSANEDRLIQILVFLFGDQGFKFKKKPPRGLITNRTFDLAGVDGVPLVYDRLGGAYQPNRVSGQLAFLEAKGVLRASVEEPTTDLGKVIDDFMRRFGGPQPVAARWEVLKQLVLLVRTVTPIELMIFEDWPRSSHVTEKFLRGLKAKGLKWNAKDARYELPVHTPLNPAGSTSY